MPWLINAAQVDKFRKNQKSVLILDATYCLPESERNGKQEFIAKHIIDAQFFDIKDFNDPAGQVPNLILQDEMLISAKLTAMGIRNDYKLIFYDNSDLHTAARALWMFKYFGHNPQQLYILDGGLAAWEKYGGKTEGGEKSPSPKPYIAKLQPEFIRNLEQMKQNATDQVVDTRHPVKYAGAPTKAGSRAGHIPGSFSFPSASCFNSEGQFISLEQLKKRMLDIGIDLNTPIVTSCGGGTTAPVLNFVFDLLNCPNAMYAGSWAEWGADKLFTGEQSLAERPVETCIS